MAEPTMPDSANGVSMTRCSPKSFCRPSVMRKTPPSLPTSSPMTRTLGSFSIAVRSDSLSALAMGILRTPDVCAAVEAVAAAMSAALLGGLGERGEILGELGALLVDQRVPVGVDVLE